MKLLLDEHLSRRVVPFLQGAYPGSTQVALIGMERAAEGGIVEVVVLEARAIGLYPIRTDRPWAA